MDIAVRLRFVGVVGQGKRRSGAIVPSSATSMRPEASDDVSALVKQVEQCAGLARGRGHCYSKPLRLQPGRHAFSTGAIAALSRKQLFAVEQTGTQTARR